MAFIRRKEFGGRVYAYEVTAYYDKELRRPRQRVKYLGRVTDQGIARSRCTSAPRVALEYGDVALLVKLSEEVGLFQTLKACYPVDVANTVLALAVNKNIRGLSLRNFRSWYEGTYLQRLTPLKNPSSQNLSRVLDALGGDERSLARFFEAWQMHNGARSAITYDLTSLSSSSSLVELLEYGYNRDGDGLPQVNFGLVTSMETELPLFFKVFPGSINDVATLKNLLAEIQSLGIKKTLFVLDRGFYSKANVLELLKEGMGFVMPVPFHVKDAQRIISETNSKAASPEQAVSFNGQVIYVSHGKLSIGEEKANYFLYFDEQRRAREINTFYKRLMEVEKHLKDRQVHSWENPESIVEEIAGKLAPYLSWKIVQDKLNVARKPKAISRAVNRMGKTILLYTGDMDWEKCLTLYRSKDTIEKMFNAMKNDLTGVPLRVQKDTTLKGSLLVTFAAMILHFSLLKRMRESMLTKEYSTEGLLLELSKIKKIELRDGTEVTTEVTKKARTILQKLSLTDIVPIT